MKLIEIALDIGTKWSTIAKRLTGRTENAVKNRFKSLIKKEKKEKLKSGFESIISSESLDVLDQELMKDILFKLR